MKFWTTVAAAVAAILGMYMPAFAGSLASIALISAVAPMQDTGGQFRICTGSTAGAYYEKAAQMTGIVSAMSGINAVAYPAGGTIDCLRKLADGEVQAAIVQRDGMAWLYKTKSPLYDRLGIGGNVLTEEVLAFCSRKLDEDDFNDVAQDEDFTIAIAGGDASGTNLTFNVLASFDDDFQDSNWIYSTGFDDAMNKVKTGFANCAVGVMSSDAYNLEALDDTYGDSLRIVNFWDGNVRDLRFPGGEFARGQVYGYRYIPKEHDGMDDFLDWAGDEGKGSWSPYTVAMSATLVYRTDAANSQLGAVTTRAAETVAKVKTDIED